MTDKTVVKKQQIHPRLVNATFQKLTKINLFYSNTTIYNEEEDFSEQADPLLCKLLTRILTRMAESLITVIRLIVMDDIEGNEKFKERELNEPSPPFATVMYSIHGPNICPGEIVNIAPG